MTVAAIASTVAYTGNGATTAYPIPFRFQENAHLVVKRGGVLLADGPDYSLAGARSESGGTLTLTSALGNGVSLTIERFTPAAQAVDLTQYGSFTPATHELALDVLALVAQDEARQREALATKQADDVDDLETADFALAASLAAESTARATAVAAEASARAAADTAETNARIAADNTEIAARSAADSALQTNITAEASARIAADAALDALMVTRDNAVRADYATADAAVLAAALAQGPTDVSGRVAKTGDSMSGSLLLVGPARRNLLLRTDEFDNALWQKLSGGSVATPGVTVANASTGPQGGTVAERVLFPAVNGAANSQYSFLRQAVTAPTTGNYVASVYLRVTSGTARLYLYLGKSGTQTYNVPTLCNVTTDWQRFEISTAASVPATTQIWLDIGLNTFAHTFTAVGAQTVEVAAAQIEQATTASTYEAWGAAYVDPTPKLGVGTSTPAHLIDVAGTVRSSVGGFVFPDGTTQTTSAAASGLASSSTVTATGSTTARSLATRFAEVRNVLDFGADPTGVAESTAAITAALAAGPAIYVPAGTYLVSSITVPANKAIRTAGVNATIFQQKSGLGVGQRVFVITGSNVVLGDCTIRGNIATDTDEQQHGVFLSGAVASASFGNVSLGHIHGENLRGDVIYVGGANGKQVSNVRIERVTATNILRNVVTVTGGEDIEIGSISGTQVGFMAFDIENNPNSTASRDIRVGYIKGAVVGVIGHALATPVAVSGVHIEHLDLDPAYQTNSTPAYGPYDVSVALLVRNTTGLRVGHYKANGFSGAVFRYIKDASDVRGRDIIFDRVDWANCSLTDTTYNTYVRAAAVDTLEIRSGSINLSASTKCAITGEDTATNVRVRLSNIDINGTLAKLVGYSEFSRINCSTASDIYFLFSCVNSVLRDSTVTSGRLAGFATRMRFENLTVTCPSFLFDGSSTDHWMENVTATVASVTTYYASGPFKKVHTNARYFGGNSYWFDAQNRLRVLAGVPTSDVQGLAISPRRITVTYAATMAIDSALASEYVITPTDGVAFTISAPTNAVTGQRITIRIRNTFGTLGAVTWASGVGGYKLSAWTQPAANGFNRAIDFVYDSSNWLETSRTPADVPN